MSQVCVYGLQIQNKTYIVIVALVAHMLWPSCLALLLMHKCYTTSGLNPRKFII